MKTGDSNSEELTLINSDAGFRLCRKRWLMLTIFIAFSASVSYLWLQYASISDIVASYYGVSTTTVDMLGTLYYLMYALAIIPITWLTEKANLKTVLLVGVSSQFVGTWVSFIGTSTQSIQLNFVGQLLSAVALPCTFGMSSQMAGTWFGINEVSLASGLGFAGCEVGVGLAFIIPPLAVQSGLDIDKQIKDLFLYTAIVMSFFLPLTVFVFEAKPPLPPSRSRMNVIKAGKNENYLQSIKAVLRNRNYVFFFISF
ncbi:uncharacterized MFS-type transporter C09D4.1-like, partial [Anneissia japonica]|uniref:uncharacterized MFS-type transporter C09D4.1-like n=1 Tax=Anneissia japonica TaxID=1529436 RepID=UPI001425A973